MSAAIVVTIPSMRDLLKCGADSKYFRKNLGRFCTNKGNDGLDDDNMAMNFTWAADSRKIVFADVKSGVMSLVVVTMPVGTKDLPRTSVYPLTGAEDVCAGVTDSAGEKYCNYGIMLSSAGKSTRSRPSSTINLARKSVDR